MSGEEPSRAGGPRRFAMWLGLVALAAFVLRLAVAAHFQGLSAPPDADSNPDQVDYERFAWSLAQGRGYVLDDGTPSARRPPGTSMTLAPVYLLAGRDFAAGRIWFAAISAASALVAGLLARALFGAAAGLIAAALVAFLPNHFYYSMHFLSEVPYGLFIALACRLGVALVRRADAGARWLVPALACGLAFGAALLTRPQVAFAAPIALLGALCSPSPLRAARVRAAMVVGAAAALLLGPWVVRNQIVLGKATLSTIGGFTFWGANNAVIAADPARAGSWMPVDTLIDAHHPLDGDELENDAAAWRYGRDYLAAHAGEIPRLLLAKVGKHFTAFRATTNRAVYWAFALGWLAVGPLALLGALLCGRGARAGLVLLLAPVASTLVTALIFYGSIRFRDADAPLYVVPAAALLARLLPQRWRA